MKQKFSGYEMSPLGAILGGVLSKAAEIRKRSPKVNDDFTLIESTLKKIHEDIFPNFTEGRQPGLFGFSRMLPAIFSQKDNLKSISRIFTSEINDDLMFELAIDLMERLCKAPKDFRDCATFLNPQALAINLESGLLGTLMKKAIGATYNVEHEGNAEPGNASYSYKISGYNYNSNQEINKKHDVAFYYAVYFQVVASKLLSRLRKYQEDCPENQKVQALFANFLKNMTEYYQQNSGNPHVGSDVNLALKLQKFVADETAMLQPILTDHENKSQRPDVDVSQLTGIKLIQAIDTELDYYATLLGQGVAINDLFDSKLSYYEQATLADVLGLPEGQIEQPLKEAYQASLPTEILGFSSASNSVVVVPIKVQLQENIFLQTKNLSILNQGINQKSSELFLQLMQAQKAWKEAEMAACVERKDGLMSELKQGQQAWQILTSVANAVVLESQDIAALAQAIHNVRQAKIDVQSLLENLDALAAKASQYTMLSGDARKIDNDLSLANGLQTIMSPVTSGISEITAQKQRILSNLAEKEKILQAKLEKAIEDAAFAESLRSEDPVKLKLLMDENKLQLMFLAQEGAQSTIQCDLAKAEIEKQEQQVKDSEDNVAVNKQLIEGQLAGLDEGMRKLIEEALDVGPPNQEGAAPSIETLMHDEPILQEWLEQQIFGIGEMVLRRSYNLVPPNDHLSTLQILSEVRFCLSKAKDFISFNDLSKLPALQYGPPPHGFRKLLNILGCTEEDVGIWQDYRDRQDSFFGLSAIERGQAKATLDQAIAHREKVVTDLLTKSRAEENAISEIYGYSLRLNDIRLALQDSNAEKLAILQRLQTLESDYQNAKIHLGEVQLLHQEKQQHLEKIQLQTEKLKGSNEVLQLRIEILQAMAPFNEVIDALIRKGEKFGAHEGLYAEMVKLNAEQMRLAAMRDKLIGVIAKLADKEDYHSVIDSLNKLLDSTSAKISGSIESMFSPEMQAITELLRGIATFEDNAVKFSTEEAPYRVAADLQAACGHLRGALVSLRKVISEQGIIVDYAATLQSLEDSLAEAERRVNVAIAGKYVEVIGEYRRSVEEDVTSLGVLSGDFSRIKDEVSFFDQKFTEEMMRIDEQRINLLERAQNNNRAVAAVKQHIALMGNRELDAGIANVENNLVGFGKGVASLGDNQSQLTSLVDVSNAMSTKLNKYMRRREERYNNKDRILSKDKDQRIEFVEDLKNQLASYARSGDSAALLEKFEEGKKRFGGLHLRTLLNKLTVDVLDHERRQRQVVPPLSGVVPVPELALAADVPDPGDHQRALDLLASFPQDQEHDQFKGAINNFYPQIESLKQYAVKISVKHPVNGGKISQLANQLVADVDRLVLENPVGKATAAQSYKAFEQIFTARLHSQDVVIRHHRPVWPIIANIAIGVGTLGVALGLKLIHSKQKEGRFALFFDKAAPIQKSVESLEKSVKANELPTTKGPPQD
jgi:hypothetical protein